MKKTHLLAIIFVAIGIAVVISASRDATSWSTFQKAADSGEQVKVIGTLVKDTPVEYNPEKDPNYLAFQLRDDAGQIRKVVLHAGKPQDFERSEQIVLTGTMKGDVFEASDMLLKCPSKYQDQEIYIRENKEG